MKRRKHHKLDFTNRTILEKLAICRRVATGVGRLPDEHRKTLTEQNPITDCIGEAEAATAEVETLKSALKAALQKRNTKVRAACDSATSAALLISVITEGDPAGMLAAGLGVVRDKQPVGKPDATQNVRALMSDFEGRVKLRWKRTVRRCWFDVEATTDPSATTGWKKLVMCFKQTCELTGLESGKKYWFRISASNAHGQGPWSQAVSVWVK